MFMWIQLDSRDVIQKSHVSISRRVPKDPYAICLAVYVDDLLINGDDLAEIDIIKKDLRNQVDMDDSGDASFILGMTIHRDRKAKTLELSQA
jgi:hypothetical protein